MPEWVREAYAVTLPETQQQGYILFVAGRGWRSIGGFRRGEQAFADVV